MHRVIVGRWLVNLDLIYLTNNIKVIIFVIHKSVEQKQLLVPQCSDEMYTMPVKYALFVFYCVAPLLLHTVDCQEYCYFTGRISERADCTPSEPNRTFDYVPIISHRIISINLDGQPLKQLPRNAFGNISSQNELTSISLIGCEIQHIDVDAFLNLDNLKHLTVLGNSISRFETGTFQHTKQLERLNAIHNKINQLQAGLFHNLVHLKVVSFENNNISSIDKDTFRNTSLVSFDVTHNKLEYLSPLFADNFTNIIDLYIGANPWNCDCNLKEYFDQYKAKSLLAFIEPRCENPSKLRGMKWVDLTSDAFICDAKIAKIRESIRELSTITINEPDIIIKESGTLVKELSTSDGPNATTTVQVTINVVLQVPKPLVWWENVHITPVRAASDQSKPVHSVP